jgi:hypothetical protein
MGRYIVQVYHPKFGDILIVCEYTPGYIDTASGEFVLSSTKIISHHSYTQDVLIPLEELIADETFVSNAHCAAEVAFDDEATMFKDDCFFEE